MPDKKRWLEAFAKKKDRGGVVEVGGAKNHFTGDTIDIGCSPEEGVPACVSILAAGSCPQSKAYGG
jgi:hypothetical protein